MISLVPQPTYCWKSDGDPVYSTFSNLKITMDRQNCKHSSAVLNCFDRIKSKQTINFAHPHQTHENQLDLCCPPSHQEATTPTPCSPLLLRKENKKVKKSAWLSKLGKNQIVFPLVQNIIKTLGKLFSQLIAMIDCKK